MTDIEFIEKRNDINRECELKKYEDYKKAEVEVNAFLIEKQKEQIKKYINAQFENEISNEKPIKSDDGKYITSCSIKGITPFDVLRTK